MGWGGVGWGGEGGGGAHPAGAGPAVRTGCMCVKFYKHCFPGVNRLSRYVFARAVRDKSWASLRPVLEEMLTRDPGFEGVSVLYSDSESALSRQNVEELKESVPRVRRVVRLSPRVGKAYQVRCLLPVCVCVCVCLCLCV